MNRLKNLFKDYIGTFCIIAVAVLAYQLATEGFGLLDGVLFPGFSRIIPRTMASLPKLGASFVSSMRLLIPGYLSAAFCGISLGVVIGLNPALNKMLKPIIFALNPIPPSMLTPYLIAVMPTFYLSSAAVIFIGCFWPFLVGTINGIILIDQKHLDNAKILEFKGLKKLFFVILPAALPMIFAGAGTALNFSFILLTVAEMFATNSGLGYFVQYYADFSDYGRVIGGLMFTGLVIITIMFMFEKLKKKMLFWTLNENK